MRYQLNFVRLSKTLLKRSNLNSSDLSPNPFHTGFVGFLVFLCRKINFNWWIELHIIFLNKSCQGFVLHHNYSSCFWKFHMQSRKGHAPYICFMMVANRPGDCLVLFQRYFGELSASLATLLMFLVANVYLTGGTLARPYGMKAFSLTSALGMGLIHCSYFLKGGVC